VWSARPGAGAEPEPEATIVVLVCDGDEKYLGTLFNDEWRAANGLFDARVVDRLASMLRHARSTESGRSTDSPIRSPTSRQQRPNMIVLGSLTEMGLLRSPT
jgi:hypothetical protein